MTDNTVPALACAGFPPPIQRGDPIRLRGVLQTAGGSQCFNMYHKTQENV